MKPTGGLKQIIIIAVLFLFVAIGIIGITAVKSQLSPQPKSYDECIQTPGSHIQETFPEQCVTKNGQTFTRPLTKEEKEKLQAPASSPTPEAKIPPGWLTYNDTSSGVSFAYPPDWQLNPDSHNFEEGDVISVWIWGDTQKEQTELYDGASLSVGKPVTTDLTLEEWVAEFIKSSSENSTSESDISENITLGSNQALETTICGLGCFTYRFTLLNNQIYEVNYMAEGPKKTTYLSQIDQILSSFKIKSSETSGNNISQSCIVTGCNGEICQGKNEQPKMSTCVYKPEYECYKTAVCAPQSGGQCGWTQTEELKDCLSNLK